MSLIVRDVTKSFQGRNVLERVNLTFEEGRTYCLMGPSGSGKTTLLRILLGLERADSGTIEGTRGKRFGMVFQEDRLCESYTALDNVMMTAGGRVSISEAKRQLCRLLPEESVTRPVRTLSGGMKRRTAVCRALLAPWDILLMDEPFTGLDEDMRRQAAGYVREKAAGKLVIVSTHQEEDAEALGAEIVRLDTCLKNAFRKLRVCKTETLGLGVEP